MASWSLLTSTYAMLVGPDFVAAVAAALGAAVAADGTSGAATIAAMAATIPNFMDFFMTLLFE
ncbi:hypothetical protein P9139_10355 [Curtobacterium flaccumfaciens]|nr:hypothetical protein P9139_10355 [Curtobacterium flaccumfaciens]